MTIREKLEEAWGPHYATWLSRTNLNPGEIYCVVTDLLHIYAGRAAIFLLECNEFAFVTICREGANELYTYDVRFADTLEELVWVKMTEASRIMLELEQVRKPDNYDNRRKT